MRKLAVTLGILFATWLPAAAARAQDVSDTSDLDALLGETVSSTASKSAQTSTTVPATAINVTAEDLRRYGIRTLADAYNFLGLGIIAEDGLGQAEIGSRGVLFTYDAGKHILLLIDGHVTNDQRNGASFHSYGAGIPIELIDHIEIMLGPGSVLYGANATLGVVNVVTKSAKDYHGLQLIAESAFSPPENQAHQPIAPRLDSQYPRQVGRGYRIGVGLGYNFHLGDTPAELTGQLEYFDFTGPQLGWTPISNGNFNYGPYTPIGVWGGNTQRSYFQRIPSGYLRLQAGNWQLTLHGVFTHASKPYSRVQEFLRDFDDPHSTTDRGYGAIDLGWNRVISSRTSMVARFYGDASDEGNRIRGSTFLGCLGSQPNGCIRTSHGAAQWFGTELQTTVKWLADLSMASMVGVEARVRRVNFESGISDLATGLPVDEFATYRAVSSNGALYGQQVYSPFPALALNAGGRWDWDNQLGQRLSPRAAATAEVWHGGTAKVVYSEAFRAPTFEERNLTNRYRVLAAPMLSPEIVRSFEASFQQRIGRQRMLVGVFRSWWSNVVQSERLSQAELSAAQRAGLIDSSAVSASQFRNVARVDNYGLNASYEGSLRDGRLSYGANLTATYARLITAGRTELMSVTPSLFGNARVSYDFGGARPVVGFVSQVTGRRLADYSQDPGVIGMHYAPPTIDFRLTGSGQIPWLRALQYRISADYAVTTTNPYAASTGGADPNKVELIPVNRATVLFGLQYGF
ncbi:MAG TPA: TonB-dependent receptor [Polyangia bacterium]|jgi:outer membrane cobalamin receptor|nr:TonB-dependent receptor [Polyangia bacterium]